jgi:VPDSG-CTERM motif
MNKMKVAIIAGFSVLTALTAGAASYDLQVTVGYAFGGTSSSGTYSGSPDTGFVTIANIGTSSFTGTFTLAGTANVGSSVNDTSGLFTLTTGNSWTLLAGPEGSNQGGFNGTLGLLLSIIGTFAGCGPIDFTVNDSNIHSGVFATNPFGVSLDNYILQGGDPLGRDTGDGFETSQAHAVFDVTCSTSVPDGGSTWMLLGSAVAGMVALRRKLTA